MHREDIQEQRAHHQRPAARAPSRQQPQQTASPHFVGTHAGMHPVDAPYNTDDVETEEEEVYDDDVFPRLPTSTRRYPGAPYGQGGMQPSRSPIPPRSSRSAVAHNVPEIVQINGQFYKVKQLDSMPAAPQRGVPGRSTYQSPIADRQTEEHLPVDQGRQPRPRSTTRTHWLLPLGMGMIGMLLLWFVASTTYNLLQLKLNDWTYGRPRTYTIDAVVGHNHDSTLNPSHFIVQNWGKRILIIEFPGGDISKAFSMQGPTLVGDGTELTPVTLTFADVSGDGTPDMILHIGDQKFYLINDQGKFRMPKPGEVKP